VSDTDFLCSPFHPRAIGEGDNAVEDIVKQLEKQLGIFNEAGRQLRSKKSAEALHAVKRTALLLPGPAKVLCDVMRQLRELSLA